MIRRYGERIMPGTRYRTRPGVYAVLTHRDWILLTHQARPVPEVQLPGGGIDPGESPLAALHREVLEETGWRIAAPRRLGAYRRFTYMPEYDLWAEKICHVYLARPVYQRAQPSEDAHAALWMPVDVGIDALASDGDRAFLARFF